MDALARHLGRLVGDAPFLGKLIVVVGLFLLAAAVSRLAGLVAARLERRRLADGTSVLRALDRRETALSLARTTTRTIAFLIALVLSILTFTGVRGAGAVASASFLAVLVGFAAQRFLMDVVAGLLMFFEGWFAVGDSIVVLPWGLEGVVEEVSLRATKLRSAEGDVLRVHNSQILATRQLPAGERRVEIELFTRELEPARRLVERVGAIVPVGPTHFVAPPQVRETEPLGDDLYRVTAAAAVAPGREWLARELLPSLMKERAADGLLVHGPVVMGVDEQATDRFARAQRVRALSGRRHRPLARLRASEQRSART